MSGQLKGDTALLMGEETLRSVWYLHSDNVEKEFLALVALNMYHAVYEARELIPVNDLTVLLKGMTAMRLRITSRRVVFLARTQSSQTATSGCETSSRSTVSLLYHFCAGNFHLALGHLRAGRVLPSRQNVAAACRQDPHSACQDEKSHAAYKREMRRRRETELDQGNPQ